MKSREFIILADSLDVSHEDFSSSEFVEEYVEEDLEIPSHYIESVKVEETYLNIKLSNTREYFNDDWYVNLYRIA